MKNKPLIDKKLADRFKALDQFPRENVNPKIDPLVLARFVKNGVSYYAIAHDEKRDEICCYVSDAKDINKPQWISINKLEQKLYFGFGKGAERDMSFVEIKHSNLEIEPNYNSIEKYFIEQKKDKEEQLRYDNMQVPNDKQNKAPAQNREDEKIIQEFSSIRDNNNANELER